MRSKKASALALGLLAILSGLIVVIQISGAQSKITASEAINHVGERATVCGRVADAKYASSSRGRPTFLNLDKAYPNQIFTVLIWGEDRDKFGRPEEDYRDKNICVTGLITSYRGVAQIQATDPSQIKVVK